MNQKWFWGTFVFLFILSVSVIGWALISSPLKFNPQLITHTEADFNGEKEKTDFWINQGRLIDLTPLITNEWTKDNWRPLGDGIDLTSVMLGSLGKGLDLSNQLQIKAFEKKGLYRTLGLWQSKDADATYGVTSDFPKAAFNSNEAKSNWKFPIPPPASSTALFEVKLQTLHIGVILLPRSAEPFSAFNEACANKGFTQTLISEEKGKKVFLLSDKKNKILVVFSQEESHNSISLVAINRI
jgi:hypothetical protein